MKLLVTLQMRNAVIGKKLYVTDLHVPLFPYPPKNQQSTVEIVVLGEPTKLLGTIFSNVFVIGKKIAT